MQAGPDVSEVVMWSDAELFTEASRDTIVVRGSPE